MSMLKCKNHPKYSKRKNNKGYVFEHYSDEELKWEVFKRLPKPDYEFEVSDQEEETLVIFPDAGCC